MQTLLIMKDPAGNLYDYDIIPHMVLSTKKKGNPEKGINSVPRQEEGSTGKYQHEVEGVTEGAARGNSRDQMMVSKSK